MINKILRRCRTYHGLHSAGDDVYISTVLSHCLFSKRKRSWTSCWKNLSSPLLTSSSAYRRDAINHVTQRTAGLLYLQHFVTVLLSVSFTWYVNSVFTKYLSASSSKLRRHAVWKGKGRFIGLLAVESVRFLATWSSACYRGVAQVRRMIIFRVKSWFHVKIKLF